MRQDAAATEQEHPIRTWNFRLSAVISVQQAVREAIMLAMDLLKRNSLMSHMGRKAFESLKPRLRPVMLESEEILYRAGDSISHIYFPETAVLCMLTIMEDGRTVEAATVGCEGASWVSASYGAPTMPCQTMVAVAGSALRIAVRYVEEEIQQNVEFHNVLTEYAHALLISSFRTGACNALHSLKQRCARWMLTTLDRISTTEFCITHQFLASLLGCNRAALTSILGDLEETGGIRIRRGRIEIADRSRLARSSCECYEIMRQNYERLAKRESAEINQRV
jgi:CRP-like cAMP-binding protein